MNKKLLLMASVSLLAATVFCACDKDKDKDGDKDTSAIAEGTTVKVDGGSELDIDSVQVRLTTDITFSFAYVNGGFTLNLPASVDDTNLSTADKGLPDGVTASNPKVKIEDGYLAAYKSGEEVGSFYHGTDSWDGFLMYANGDVNITGTASEGGFTFNVKLKKGWNIVYDRDNKEYTTTAPVGAKWYYEANE
jgi:hypothetical protein